MRMTKRSSPLTVALLRIWPDDAYDLMWTPAHETPYGAPWSHWGAGWFMTEMDGHPVVWMGGADLGYGADAMLCPDENLAVIVMSNGANPVSNSLWSF